MQVVKSYPDNMFCWVDLATTDPAGAKEFFSGLFGWGYFDIPTPMGTHYTLCQIDGYNVAGLSDLPQEMADQGIPPVWSSYIKHDDVDAVAERAVAAGGTVAMPAMDVMESGRMIVLPGPDGGDGWSLAAERTYRRAAGQHAPTRSSGTSSRPRMSTPRRSFYGEVFGWGHDQDPNGYNLFKLGDRMQAGMLKMDDSWGDVSAQLGALLHVRGHRGDGGQGKGVGRRHSCSADPYGHGWTVRRYRGPAGRGLHLNAV